MTEESTIKYDFVKCGIVSDSGKIIFPDEARCPDESDETEKGD